MPPGTLDSLLAGNTGTGDETTLTGFVIVMGILESLWPEVVADILEAPMLQDSTIAENGFQQIVLHFK